MEVIEYKTKEEAKDAFFQLLTEKKFSENIRCNDAFRSIENDPRFNVSINVIARLWRQLVKRDRLSVNGVVKERNWSWKRRKRRQKK